MSTVPLSCRCGRVRGQARRVSPRAGLRLVCHCDDCQTFAHFLERADDVLDAHGGTEVFQFTPARLTIDEGVDQLRCVKLAPKGPQRWYTACCRTPVANVLPAPMAFASLVQPFYTDAEDPGAHERAMGPVVARVQGRYAKGRPAGVEPSVGPLTLTRAGLRLLWATVWREATPSPFLDEAGQPRVAPELIALEERNRLREAAGFPPR